MGETKVSVLLVEDNDFDVKRVLRGFAKLGDSRPIIRARDGLEALSIIRGEADTESLSKPFVVMLDLNMPRMGGLEFLDEIRTDEALRKTPVCIVTTSEFHLDIGKAYDRMVSGFFVKPDTADEMINVLKTLSQYWDACVFAD